MAYAKQTIVSNVSLAFHVRQQR